MLWAGWMIQEAPDWALQNVASLTQTAVVGSVATGSHGSSGVDPATGRAILSSNSGYVNRYVSQRAAAVDCLHSTDSRTRQTLCSAWSWSARTVRSARSAAATQSSVGS